MSTEAVEQYNTALKAGQKFYKNAVASLYMGATGMGYAPYLLGSLTGLLPVIVSYALMGRAADEPKSPEFLAGAAAIAVTTVLSILLYALLLHRAARKTRS